MPRMDLPRDPHEAETRQRGEDGRPGPHDHIVVTVVEIRGDKVRLGIDAPKEVTVHRREVYEAIQSQTKAREGTTPAITPEGGVP